ncbi:MAG TPA: hypothetical protein V6C72_17180, partial [Chroococcales cyanobacterium]
AVLAVVGLMMVILAQVGTATLSPQEPMTDKAVLYCQSTLGAHIVLSALTAAVVTIICGVREIRQASLVLSSALLCGSLLYTGWRFTNQATAPDFFDDKSQTAELLCRLKNSPPEQIRVLGLYLERFTIPDKFRSPVLQIATVKNYAYARQVLRPNTNLDFGIGSANGFEGAMVGDYYYTLLNLYDRSSQSMEASQTGQVTDALTGRVRTPDDAGIYRFCQLTATDFVLTQMWRVKSKERARAESGPPAAAENVSVPLLDGKYFDLVREEQDLNLRVYQVKEALPRAYVSPAWQWMPSHNQAEHAVFEVQASNFDPRRCTLVEHSVEHSIDAKEGRGDLDPPGDPMTFEEANRHVVQMQNLPEYQKYRVGLPKPGLFVLADQYYPGWQATVDGEVAPVLKANAFMRAVAVPAGDHTIAFTFKPRSLSIAGMLAFIGVVWIAVLGASEYVTSRRPEA